MKYLLDTDHLSILQRATGEAYLHLSSRMARCSVVDFGVSIVTFHEQVIGVHAEMNQRKSNALLKGYERMSSLIDDFQTFQVVGFGGHDDEILKDLQRKQVRGSSMDLRIASIALSQDLILLTRNTKDFIKVPDLKFEDWTIPKEGFANGV
jgi:tRNA(fMet)-specific endonuclease VapC